MFNLGCHLEGEGEGACNALTVVYSTDMKQQPQKTEKPPPPWSVVRGLFSCKHPQERQQQMQERKQKQKQPQQQKQEEESGGQREAAHEQKLRMKERKHEHNQEKRSNEASKKCKKTKEKKHEQNQEQGLNEGSKKCKKMKCSGSLCSNTKVMHRPELAAPSPELQRKRANSSSSNSESSSRSMKPLLNEFNGVVSSTNSSLSANSSNNTNMSGTSSRGMPFRRFAGCYGCRMVVDPVSSTNSSLSANSSNNTNMSGTSRGMPFRRFAGCYECRMVVDPVLGIARDPSLRSSICFCPECGEIFMKPESLDLHQAVRHAVSELSPEDTSKNIVEIIFQSSWLKKENPVCKIDRILKVHNTQRTISRFEEYRDSIKAKVTKLIKKHPRCIADGNELLRFHSTTFSCSIGLDGSSNLCNSIPQCNVCSIIKNGFKDCTTSQERGILTTATSGKAHDKAAMILDDKSDRRAMLVCRVIAGRVKKSMEGNVEEYDSVAGAMGLYSNLDELYVFNPTAILPCFVVIYSGF